MQSAQEQVHRESLEEEATHATDEARMLLPGVQAVLGFQLVAVTNQRFVLFKSYPICTFSGDLGPKLAEGDRQAPEGFYRVTVKQLNPASRHHLAFNVGFPNAFDRQLERTGSELMVHGGCSSVGCYAMGDAQVDEIYALVDAALRHIQDATMRAAA